jgi:hypothetical protein
MSDKLVKDRQGKSWDNTWTGIPKITIVDDSKATLHPKFLRVEGLQVYIEPTVFEHAGVWTF